MQIMDSTIAIKALQIVSYWLKDSIQSVKKDFTTKFLHRSFHKVYHNQKGMLFRFCLANNLLNDFGTSNANNNVPIYTQFNNKFHLLFVDFNQYFRRIHMIHDDFMSLEELLN